jgi:hypothetical protein
MAGPYVPKNARFPIQPGAADMPQPLPPRYTGPVADAENIGRGGIPRPQTVLDSENIPKPPPKAIPKAIPKAAEFVESAGGEIGGSGSIPKNPSTPWKPGASKVVRAGKYITGGLARTAGEIALPMAVMEGAHQMAKEVDNINTAPGVERTKRKYYTMDEANAVPSTERIFGDPKRNRPTGSIAYTHWKDGAPVDVKQEMPAYVGKSKPSGDYKELGPPWPLPKDKEEVPPAGKTEQPTAAPKLQTLEQYVPKKRGALPKNDTPGLEELLSAVGGGHFSSAGDMTAAMGLTKMLNQTKGNQAARADKLAGMEQENDRADADNWYKNQQIKQHQNEQDMKAQMLPHEIDQHKMAAKKAALDVENYHTKKEIQEDKLDARDSETALRTITEINKGKDTTPNELAAQHGEMYSAMSNARKNGLQRVQLTPRKEEMKGIPMINRKKVVTEPTYGYKPMHDQAYLDEMKKRGLK